MPFCCSKHSVLLCNTILLSVEVLTMVHRPYSADPQPLPLGIIYCPHLVHRRGPATMTPFFFFKPTKHDPTLRPLCCYLFPLPRTLIPDNRMALNITFFKPLFKLIFSMRPTTMTLLNVTSLPPPALLSSSYYSIFLCGTLYLQTYYIVY